MQLCNLRRLRESSVLAVNDFVFDGVCPFDSVENAGMSVIIKIRVPYEYTQKVASAW